jgi:hypothetical protein
MTYEAYWVSRGSGWELWVVPMESPEACQFWDYCQTFGASVQYVYDYSIMYEEWLDQYSYEMVIRP